jgi:hypothetical protein
MQDNEVDYAIKPRPNILEVTLIDIFPYELAHSFRAVG